MTPKEAKIKSIERKMEPKPVTVAGVLVVRQTDLGGIEVLLAKRLTKPEKGRYSPPGGKIKKSESERDCASREVWEETDLKIDASELKVILLGKQTFTRSGRVYVYNGYVARWDGSMGEPINKEPKKHEDWQWFDLNDLSILKETEQLSLAAIALLDAYKYKTETGRIFEQDFAADRLMANSLL